MAIEFVYGKERVFWQQQEIESQNTDVQSI